MLVSDYVTRLKRRLGDSGTYFTTNEIVDYCNEAQRDISVRLRPALVPELTTVQTGDLTGSTLSLPSDVAQQDSLTLYNTTNRDIEVTLVGSARGVKRLKEVNYLYRPTNKQFTGYLDNDKIYVEPTPAITMKYRFRYVKSPADLTSSQEMDLDPRWGDLALDYGQYQALMHEKREGEGQVAYQKYLERIEKANGGGK